MVRVLTVLIVLMMVGCTTSPEKIKTETIEVIKPVLYCPPPDWSGLRRPTLAIEHVTGQTPDGEVAKRYRASIIQLKDYAERLETALKQYDKTSQDYEKIKTELLTTKQRTVILEKETPGE